MASPGRVQVPEFQREAQLSPAPVVNVQAIAPVNRQGAGSNLLSIADSLAGLSSSFARFAQTQKSETGKQDAILAGDLSSMTAPQLAEHFKNNPDLLQKEKVAMMYAGKYANQFGIDLQSGKLTEDWDGQTPLSEHLAKKQQEYLGQLPDDPMIRAFFNETANPYIFNYTQGRAKLEAENRTTEDVGVLKSHIDNIVEQSKAVTGAANSAPGVAKRLPLLTGTQAGRQPLNTKGLQGVMVDRWEQVQGAFGRQLPVVSGYRDPKTNAAAGGAKKSRHLHGDAIDIDVSSLDFAERRRLIEIASGMGFTGIGVYRNSIHLDMRPNKTAWGPTHGKESVPAWAQMTIAKHLGGAIKSMPYSVNTSAVAVDNVFQSLAETPQWSRLLPNQRTALIYDYAASITPKTEDDLRLIEGLLTSRRSDGVPSVAEDIDYSVKVRTLIEQRKEEFRQLNETAKSPIVMEVEKAIAEGKGIPELRRLREGAGNILPEEYWTQADLKMQESQLKLEALITARNAHNAAVDQEREKVRAKIAFGEAFAGTDIPDVTVPDPDKPGETKTITGKQLFTDVKNDILNKIEEQATKENLPDEIKWGLTANFFSKTNETIDTWEQQLRVAPTYLTAAVAAKNVPEQAVNTAKLYDYLKDSGNYMYLDAHMKGDNVKQFWLMYDSFRGLGQDEREALFSTYQILNTPDALSVASEEINYADKMYFNTSGQSFVKSELNGDSIAAGQVRRMAVALAAARTPGDEALTRATEIFKSTHEYVQGAWVPKNLKGLPENFKDNMEEYVSDYITRYGAKANPPVTDPDDVLIAPDASGSRFYLFQKSTGLPLMAKDARGTLSRTGVLAVSLQSLRDFDKLKNDRQAIQTEDRQRLIQKSIENPITMKGVTMNPDSQADILAEQRRKETEAGIRRDPQVLGEKSDKLKTLDDETLKGYLRRSRPGRNEGTGKYLPEETQIIKDEILYRIGEIALRRNMAPKDVNALIESGRRRWNISDENEILIKLWENGAFD